MCRSKTRKGVPKPPFLRSACVQVKWSLVSPGQIVQWLPYSWVERNYFFGGSSVFFIYIYEKKALAEKRSNLLSDLQHMQQWGREMRICILVIFEGFHRGEVGDLCMFAICWGLSECACVCVCVRVRVPICEWDIEWLRECVTDWLSEWLTDWVTEWVTEWVCVRVCV